MPFFTFTFSDYILHCQSDVSMSWNNNDNNKEDDRKMSWKKRDAKIKRTKKNFSLFLFWLLFLSFGSKITLLLVS